MMNFMAGCGIVAMKRKIFFPHERSVLATRRRRVGDRFGRFSILKI